MLNVNCPLRHKQSIASEACRHLLFKYYYGTLLMQIRVTLLHDETPTIIHQLKCDLGVLCSPKCCQWSTVGFCCFLSANSRSKSQPGGNTARSFWASLTVVWHQPPGWAEAGPQDTTRSVWASILLGTAHSSTIISQCCCQFRILGKQWDKKISFSNSTALWNESFTAGANVD